MFSLTPKVLHDGIRYQVALRPFHVALCAGGRVATTFVDCHVILETPKKDTAAGSRSVIPRIDARHETLERNKETGAGRRHGEDPFALPTYWLTGLLAYWLTGFQVTDLSRVTYPRPSLHGTFSRAVLPVTVELVSRTAASY